MIRDYIANQYQNGQNEEARRSVIFELKHSALIEITDQDEAVGIAEVLDPTEAEITAAEAAYYASRRAHAYGSPVAQMEYITEHGIQAWQVKVAEIKEQFPKPPQE